MGKILKLAVLIFLAAPLALSGGHPVKRSAKLISLYVAQGVLQGLDTTTTIRALHSPGLHEANPLLAPLASNTALFIAFKAAVTVGTIYSIDRLYRHHPKLAIGLLGGIDGAYGYVVWHNYRAHNYGGPL